VSLKTQIWTRHHGTFSKLQGRLLAKIIIAELLKTSMHFAPTSSFMRVNSRNCSRLLSSTDFVSKALYLRLWGIPFDALAYVFGHDPKYWEHQWLALDGRPL
jgi:hypothetical protein